MATSSRPSNTTAKSRCCAHVTACASSPTRASGASAAANAAQRVALLRDGGTDLDLGVDAGGGELFARLRAVPAVGGEHQPVVGHQSIAALPVKPVR